MRTDVDMMGDRDLASDESPYNDVAVDAQYYWDFVSGYTFNDTIVVYAGISDVLDEQLPLIGFPAGGDLNAQAQLYDTVGCLYFIGTTACFGSN